MNYKVAVYLFNTYDALICRNYVSYFELNNSFHKTALLFGKNK